MSGGFGATILDATGLRLSPDEKALFRDADPFGFILFARNIDTPDQIRALCDDMREAVGRDCLITIDQEGGRVQRLRAPLGREWMPPLDHAVQAGKEAPRAMYLRYRLIAQELRALGIDSNCAPLADIAGADTHPFLKNRCYGETAADVAELSRAVAAGHLDGGVVPVLKHIPGHGRAVADSHHDLPHVATSFEELEQTDFAPFQALNDLPMAMTAHIVFEALDQRPATLSQPVMNMIRQQIGFDGLIMTDDISMKALKGAPQDIARQSRAAGCDIVLLCNADLPTRTAVAEAAGRLDETGQMRALKAVEARKTPAPLDIEAAEAELAALMGGKVYV
ncbi:beta-N-acetylhexosaminidase [Phaeobacter sp. PT47_59]|uniref:beta-N-acetylhexosaminidase n=1 Tax=Phaeobacter sp. PT47_59 TaxID=3029979 RepID=UPI0023800A07|nr:beta-N-acetylhexosaminidase [Phaeobacter sp. PT47_59]MDE4175154.1 beta-N-acetylhexosaminidase [Phaeobacter sp. PT47_59]